MRESICDATDIWKDKKHRMVGGIYIVRSQLDGEGDKVRIGVGGIRKGKNGIYGRLANHSKTLSRNRWKFATHEFQPYSVVKAWHLDGWLPQNLEDAEMCLYRAFVTRFPRYDGQLPDKSLFVVPSEELTNVIEEIDRDLRAIAHRQRSMEVLKFTQVFA